MRFGVRSQKGRISCLEYGDLFYAYAVIRYMIAMMICILSVIIAKDSNFRMFMLILVPAMIGVLIIYHVFWKGLDSGDFTKFFSQEDLEKRDVILRFCSILVQYSTIVTIVLYAMENIVGLIISILLIVLFIVESVLFFRMNKTR